MLVTVGKLSKPPRAGDGTIRDNTDLDRFAPNDELGARRQRQVRGQPGR